MGVKYTGSPGHYDPVSWSEIFTIPYENSQEEVLAYALLKVGISEWTPRRIARCIIHGPFLSQAWGIEFRPAVRIAIWKLANDVFNGYSTADE